MKQSLALPFDPLKHSLLTLRTHGVKFWSEWTLSDFATVLSAINPTDFPKPTGNILDLHLGTVVQSGLHVPGVSLRLTDITLKMMLDNGIIFSNLRSTIPLSTPLHQLADFGVDTPDITLQQLVAMELALPSIDLRTLDSLALTNTQYALGGVINETLSTLVIRKQALPDLTLGQIVHTDIPLGDFFKYPLQLACVDIPPLKAGCCASILSNLNMTFQLHAAHIRVLISFLQMLSVLGINYLIDWPLEYRTLFGFCGFINLELDVFKIDCIGFNISYYDRLMAMTLSPVVFGLVCFAYYKFQLLGQPFYAQFSGFRRDAAANSTKAFLFFITLVYPAVCRTVLLMFKTKEINGSQFLEADMRYTTDHPSHLFYFSYAFLMVLIYPVGVPLTLILMLRGRSQRQSHGNHGGDTLSVSNQSDKCCYSISLETLDDATAFLMSGIEAECWYYEVTELIRKLLLSSVIIFVHPGTFAQIAAALLLCVGFMTHHFFAQPFIEGSADNLQSVPDTFRWHVVQSWSVQ